MFSKLKTYFSEFSRHLHGIRHRTGINPSADWMMLLGGFLICTVSVGLLTFFMYAEILGGDEQGSVAASSTPQVVTHELINRVVDYYEAKRANVQTILKTPVTLVDPSR